MNISDFSIVFATFMGPVVAVQLQKYLDRKGETNRRQVEIFRALMANRVTSNSPQYVNALNAVPLEFHKVKPVMSAWSDLLMHLNSDSTINSDAWLKTRVKRFLTLLKTMGEFLRYDFRDAELEDHAYFPKWQDLMMKDQELVRKGLVDLLGGKASLPMNVTGFPVDAEMSKRTGELQQLLVEWLQGKRAPSVTTSTEPQVAK